MYKNQSSKTSASLNDHEDNTDYKYIFKIILIGDSNTGKTSLINRFIYNTFDLNYMCTIGVDFMMKKVELDESTVVKLQLWDTAGMEKYRQITSNYFRGAQGAIVVFDLTNRESFTMIQKWIDFFYQTANPQFHQTIIIVGNKSDLIDQRKVSPEEINKYISMNKFQYYETSAKSGNNVDNLFIDFTKQLVSNIKTTGLNLTPLGGEGEAINLITSNGKDKNEAEEKDKNTCCLSR